MSHVIEKFTCPPFYCALTSNRCDDYCKINNFFLEEKSSRTLKCLDYWDVKNNVKINTKILIFNLA